MKKSKFIVLVMMLLGLSLGGCSFFSGQSAQKQEMIQIAKSKKAEDVIENSLKYNPMGGLIVKVIINDDDNLTITTTLTEESDGKFEQNGYVISGELSAKLRGE